MSSGFYLPLQSVNCTSESFTNTQTGWTHNATVEAVDQFGTVRTDVMTRTFNSSTNTVQGSIQSSFSNGLRSRSVSYTAAMTKNPDGSVFTTMNAGGEQLQFTVRPNNQNYFTGTTTQQFLQQTHPAKALM